MLIGGLIALTLTAALGGLFLIRLRRHLQKNLDAAIGQQLGLSRRMTEIIIQLQQNHIKHEEQLQKLAEFSLKVKKDVQLIAERQAVSETNSDDDFLTKSEPKTKYLN